MKDCNFSISVGSVLKIVMVLVGVYLLWVLRDIALIVLTSIVIASAIEPATKSLRKYKVPRVLAVLFVYTLFFSAFFGVILFMLPPILTETEGLLRAIPGYINNIDTLNASQSNLSQTFGQMSDQINAILQGVRKGDFLSAVSFMFGGIMSLVLIIVFSFYFAINEKGIEEFLRILTPKEKEEYIVGLWKRSQAKIGLWMQGQLLLGVLIGVLVYLVLAVLGVPYALPLGVIAGLFELIPVFGPILSAVPGIALAFTTGGFTLALMVLGAYVIIQQLENNLIYPLVVTKVVGVPPVLVILALLVGAKLAGILGILLSVPLAAVLQEVFDDWGKFKKGAAR